jgi:hypothetical protein
MSLKDQIKIEEKKEETTPRQKTNVMMKLIPFKKCISGKTGNVIQFVLIYFKTKLICIFLKQQYFSIVCFMILKA